MRWMERLGSLLHETASAPYLVSTLKNMHSPQHKPYNSLVLEPIILLLWQKPKLQYQLAGISSVSSVGSRLYTCQRSILPCSRLPFLARDRMRIASSNVEVGHA